LEDMSWEVDNVNLKEEVLQYVGTWWNNTWKNSECKN
jgi:hypothetical protein